MRRDGLVSDIFSASCRNKLLSLLFRRLKPLRANSPILLAEREGFEPSDPLRGQHISSVSHSTTLAPLHIVYFITNNTLRWSQGIMGLVGWPSGLRQRSWKPSGVQASRGFESHSHRHGINSLCWRDNQILLNFWSTLSNKIYGFLSQQ